MSTVSTPPPELFALLVRNLVGPRLITTFVQCVELGIVLNQTVRFVTDGGGKRPVINFTAAFVTFAAISQTSVAMYEMWELFVQNFLNPIGALEVTFGYKFTAIFILLMAAPVQAFLTWRCWVLSKRSLFVLLLLILLWIGSIVISIWLTVRVFMIDFAALLALAPPSDSSSPGDVPPDPYFLASLALPAALDVCLTSILLTYFMRSRSKVVSQRFQRILSRLTVTVWEAALPPCLCAILTIVTFFAFAHKTSWDLLFQGVLGQLYVISFYVSVNGFRYAKEKEMGFNSKRAWNADGLKEVRLDVDPSAPSDVEQPNIAVYRPGAHLVSPTSKFVLSVSATPSRSRSQLRPHTSPMSRPDWSRYKSPTGSDTFTGLSPVYNASSGFGSPVIVGARDKDGSEVDMLSSSGTRL